MSSLKAALLYKIGLCLYIPVFYWQISKSYASVKKNKHIEITDWLKLFESDFSSV